MYPKTDSSEFAPGFVWQVFLLAALILGFTITAQKAALRVTSNVVHERTWTLFPWIAAGAYTLHNGLAAFSGDAPKLPTVGDQARVLTAVLITFVICPTGFLLGWRRRRLNRESVPGKSQLRISSLLYGFSGVLTLFVAASIIPINIASESLQQGIRERQAVQDNRDQIINDLHLLALDIYQYRLLPREFDGGGGSYRGYTLPEKPSSTKDATYSVSVKDDEVTICAQSIPYPTASVEVKVDTMGRFVWWKFPDEFQ
jgi:hypothetical protein